MKWICVSLFTLFEHLSNGNPDATTVNTAFGRIEKTSEDDGNYYDFKTEAGICCMDGEICRVLSDDGAVVTLCEMDGNTAFRLTKDEFKIAHFASP